MTPRRLVAVLGLALLLVTCVACGKYGPPVRTPVAPESLPRYDLKTKRVFDNRPTEMRRALER